MNLKEFVQQNTLRCVIGAFVLGIIVLESGCTQSPLNPPACPV